MNQIPNIEEEYTSHEALKEWEKEKDQNNLTQNIVALLGIHGMHCKFYEYQNASHITKAFEDLFHHQLQKAREEERERIEAIFKKHVPPHAMDLEDSVWLKRLLNKVFQHD